MNIKKSKNVVNNPYIDTTTLFVVKYTLIKMNIADDEDLVIIGVFQRAYGW
ncbi:hypothetical protein [uncultured Finegoldia sp.]|uniref:hypothetical protein n=1 Tax=uncultured Finegoldia sp. TaxID=328009 RepID=UPI002626FB46|nr:hypothetical protein [uncultured Finegoldia sp.]